MGEMEEMWEQKLEELMALESIYGSDFSLLGNEGSSACTNELAVSSLAMAEMPPESSVIECQVRISVDIPDAGLILTHDPRVVLEEQSSVSTSAKVSEDDWQSQSSNEIQSSESIIIRILRYDAVRSQQIFRDGTWKCPVCMDDKLGKNFVRLPICCHIFCTECFSEYCRVNVECGQVDLVCPEHKCSTALEPHILQEALSKKDYDRWEEILLQRTLDKMKDVHYCPRCSFVCVEESGCFAQCEKCFFAFCTKCYDPWHPGSDCISLEESIAAIRGATPQETLRLRKDRANQALSQAAIKTFSKECPGCGIRINRSEGCNKMKCTFCDTHFCYKCGAVIADYTHFWDGNCILFDDEEIRRLGALEAPAAPAAMAAQDRRMMRDVILEQGRENGVRIYQTRCPFCGQHNAKHSNNNHIRCWACSLGYCHLCGSGLGKKMGSHFTQGGCKQHTED